MKNVLIASFDMEVGGVERSLVSMLNNFDYKSHKIDLMLYSHTGDFLDQLPKESNLLPENPEYKSFRLPILALVKNRRIRLAMSRLMAKYRASLHRASENGYRQMQYMWKYSISYLPKLEKEYDVAISYLWPHYFVAEKVKAKKKIAWIHTDYSTIDTDKEIDVLMWDKFNFIIAVSDECKEAFVKKYPCLEEKTLVIENINSPEVITSLAGEKVDNPMIRDPRFKIVTIARLSHAKGIDNAVKALRMLIDQGHKNIAWYVVGNGGDEQKIKNLIKKNKLENNFFLLGKKINPYPYLIEADIYVQPSRYEGKAVTVTEAKILGKPILVTNFPTAKSQLNNGIEGIICDLSVEGISKGILSMYEDKFKRDSLREYLLMQDYRNNKELDKLYITIDKNYKKELGT
ncbi:glycosyltransferase [Rossellomorea vietnamensis]|uniref:Capsular biosynthesis protein n=1 Tax=Rossellomorea vietnamensis TaxID=218284 RepID=A0A0P6WJ63_9BACI|nr:glycosyltransferase [Rossellomorea vietnamensis]KPL57775.1 capsular biosynthesis protein [Rossellomorea vietnamensis]